MDQPTSNAKPPSPRDAELGELTVAQLEHVYGGRFGVSGLEGLDQDHRNILLQWHANALGAGR